MAITDKEVRIFLPLTMFFSIIVFLAFFSSLLNMTITGHAILLPSNNLYINESTVLNSGASPYSITDSDQNGVIIINSSNVVLDCNGSTILGPDTGKGAGIVNMGFDNVTIKNCTVKDYYVGIYMWNAKGCRIENNIISDIGSYGIELSGYSDSNIIGNDIASSGLSGIIVRDSSTNNVLSNNIITSNFVGVNISSSNNTLSNNNISANSENGLIIKDTYDIKVNSGEIKSNSLWDIVQTNSTDIILNNVNYNNSTKNAYLVVNATDSNYAPISAAEFTLKFISGTGGNFSSTLITAADGIAFSAFPEFRNRSGIIESMPPCDVSVTKTGYSSNSTMINFNETQYVHLIINPVEMPAETVYFNVSVTDPTGAGKNANLTIYLPGTQTVNATYNESSGIFSDKELMSGIYDMLFSVDEVRLLLRTVNISANLNKLIGIDKLATLAMGFNETYGVSSTYSASSIQLFLPYNQSLYFDENGMVVYKCANWNFAARTCTGNWSKLTEGVTQLKTENYFVIDTATLSGFGFKYEPYCGDGICSSNENKTSCPLDCGVITLNQCSQGVINASCLCGGAEYSSGYCCSNMWQTTPCISVCFDGRITINCTCSNAIYSSGYCCNNVYQTSPCQPVEEVKLQPISEPEEETTGEKGGGFNIIYILFGLLALMIFGGIGYAVYHFSRKPKEEPEEAWASGIKVKTSDVTGQQLPQKAIQPKPAQQALQVPAVQSAIFTPEKIKEILEKEKNKKEKTEKEKVLEELRKISES